METFTWLPDHEYKEEIDYDVDRTVYAGGKQQRYLNNPDPVVHKFYANFFNRSQDEIAQIVNFLKARKGTYEAFCYASRFEGDYAGAADSGTTTRCNDTALDYADRFFCGRIIRFTSGSNEGEERQIIASGDGYVEWSTDYPLPFAVAADDEYVILYKVNLASRIPPKSQRGIVRQINLVFEVSN